MDRVLWYITPFSASLSLLMVLTSILTGHWLTTTEKMLNGTASGLRQLSYVEKHTVSGLWTLCESDFVRENASYELKCHNIEYFPVMEYLPNPEDSTMAIPYAVTRSSVFFIFSTVLLICGEISYMYGHFVFHKKIFTFVAGVVFIISGLMMLIGLVMYISIFKAEVGPKLRPRSPLQPPLFTFSYGYSFLLYVTSFISIELSGTFALFLYIYWYQNECSLDNMQFNSVNQPLYPNQSSYQSGANCRRHHPPYLQPLSIIAQCSPSDVNQRRYYFSRSPSSSREDSPFPRITDISSTYQAELERGGHLDVHYGGWVEEMAYHNSTGWEYSPEDAFVTIDLPLPPDIMDVNQGVGSGGTSKKTTLV